MIIIYIFTLKSFNLFWLFDRKDIVGVYETVCKKNYFLSLILFLFL